MTNRQKGKLHEKRVSDYLINKGYLVERGFKKATFIGGRFLIIDKDLFGAFDIVAIKKPDQVLFVQVTASDADKSTSNLVVRKRKTFGTWPAAEVWEHIKAGIYRRHLSDGNSYLVDTRAKAPKVPAEAT